MIEFSTMKNCYFLLGIVIALCLVNQEVFCAPSDSNSYAALPWLKDILNEDDTLTLPSGQYKLGSDKDISVRPLCRNTPYKVVDGKCFLLKDCHIAYPKLKTVDDYVESFCLLENEYAGVCCPDGLELFSGGWRIEPYDD